MTFTGLGIRVNPGTGMKLGRMDDCLDLDEVGVAIERARVVVSYPGTFSRTKTTAPWTAITIGDLLLGRSADSSLCSRDHADLT